MKNDLEYGNFSNYSKEGEDTEFLDRNIVTSNKNRKYGKLRCFWYKNNIPTVVIGPHCI
jgi:hypothetical protein